jgi:hypothetical protein
MSHTYKQVAPTQPEPLSFVKAVKAYGDLWALALPDNVKHSRETTTHDGLDAASMYYMEKGLFPRVRDYDCGDWTKEPKSAPLVELESQPTTE